MKTALVTINEQRKETGETVLFLGAKEVGVILASLEMYSCAHKRSKLASTLVKEFELLPWKNPKPKKRSYKQIQCPTCKHLIYEGEKCHRHPIGK